MEDAQLEKLKKACAPMIKKYASIIKAIWIYGSAVRAETAPADIDMMILVDDTSEIPDAKIMELRRDMEAVDATLKKENVAIHWQPPKPLSLWWDMLRGGNPLAFTSMRDALSIYDPGGYVAPLQILLKQGRLAGTREQAEELMGRAPVKLEKARRIFLEEITADLMAAMTEASHAVLMFAGVPPPTKSNVRTELRQRFVARGLLEEKYVEDYENFFELAQRIEHGDIQRLSGKELDRWLEKVVAFIERLERLFLVLEVLKRKDIINAAHHTAFEAAREALQRLGEKAPERPEQIIENFKKYFVDTGLVAKEHLNVLQKLYAAKKAAVAGKIGELPEREVYESEVYAKNLADTLHRIRGHVKVGEVM